MDAEQRLAAEAVAGPVCVIAGAGTGKTRTVTHRLAHAIASGAIPRASALAVTHTSKAAAELRDRLAALGLAGAAEARTFHAAALRIASKFWQRTDLPGPGPVLLGRSDEWATWRSAARAVTGSDPDVAVVRDALSEVNWARSRLVKREQYPDAAIAADRDPGVALDQVVDIWASVEQAKKRLAKVDFADLLEIAAFLLEADDEVASQVRRRWAHVTVDEYQDTDPAQQRLLDAILGGSREVCVVGDPRQAIYSFKGAETSFLIGFKTRYREAQVIELVRNYRSSPQVLTWANRVAAGSGAKRLVATRAEGPSPTITRHDDERSETATVIRSIRKLIDAGTPPTEIAVLYRYNAQQARFEAELARADIATTVAADETFFERDEIRQVLADFGRAAAQTPAGRGLDVLTAAMVGGGFNPDVAPAGQGAARARWESQRALLDVVASLPDVEQQAASRLFDELAALAAHSHGPRTGGVTLATMHGAKGLEWDVVFIVSAVDGSIPAAQAGGDTAKLAEEERLLHVAVTRARRELRLTWAATNERGWRNKPSPFLERLSPTPVRPSPAKPRTSTSRRGANRARSSAECPHCTEPLKGISARRVGVCANCVRSAPGDIGVLARALAAVVAEAAARLDLADEKLLSGSGLLRLLDARPTDVDSFATTLGVSHAEEWAEAAVNVLAP